MGDTVYKWIKEQPQSETQDVPIILVAQSHWGDNVASVRKLYNFIERTHTHSGTQIHLSSEHTMSGEDTISLVQDAITFVERIAAGDVPIFG